MIMKGKDMFLDMYKKIFRDIFGVSPEFIKEILENQYKRERNSRNDFPELLTVKGNEGLDARDTIYTFLSEPNRFMDSVLFYDESVDQRDEDLIDIDRLIEKIDAKIAELEKKEKVHDDSKQEETSYEHTAEDGVDIDRLIEMIDAKIAELEKEEEKCNDTNQVDEKKLIDEDIKTNENTLGINQFFPEQGFSDYYCLLYYIAYMNETVLYPLDLEWNPGRSPNFLGLIASDLNCKIRQYCKSKLDPRALEHVSLRYLNEVCKYFLNKGKMNSLDCKFLQLCVQLNAFVQMLLNSNNQKKIVIEIVVTTISIRCANICFRQDDNKNAIRFSVIALNTDDPAIRQDAFNTIGFCAIESNQYQFAYNIYFSWIYKHTVDLSKFIHISDTLLRKIDFALKSDREQKWRDRKNKKVAIMYGNYAYLCSTMCDQLQPSQCRGILQCQAKFYITLAILKNPNNSGYQCSAGSVFWDRGEYQEAISYYKKYYSDLNQLNEQVDALRMLLSVYNNVLDENIYEDYRKLATEYLKKYKELSNTNSKNDIDEIINGRDLYYLLSECSLLSEDNKNLMFSLLRIGNDIRGILGELKWKSHVLPHYDLHINMLTVEECKQLSIENIIWQMEDEASKTIEDQANEIAYYTTYHNLQFLFEEHQLDNNSVNCLTMMHVRYMNDPEEGLILLKNLKDFLPETPEKLRDELYDQKYVFVKSFTGLVDKLNMWTAYGSDLSKGKDCNGCCVCFAPETFDMVINLQDKSPEKSSIKKEDDFHLYNVAYMVGDSIIVGGIENKIVREKYDQLTKHLSSLKNALQNVSDTDTNIITNALTRLLGKIIFLFKDSSYQLETESRLIITRDVKDRVDILKTSQEPPKLYINPPFQVFPEKIILGPKTENAEYWIPFLQYELSKMSEKWKSASAREFKPVVRFSDINIR